MVRLDSVNAEGEARSAALEMSMLSVSALWRLESFIVVASLGNSGVPSTSIGPTQASESGNVGRLGQITLHSLVSIVLFGRTCQERHDSGLDVAE